MDKLPPVIRALATELLDNAIDAGGEGVIDVISQYANQLPSRVMAHILAIPDNDQAMFSEWTSDIGLIFGAAVAKDTLLLRHVEYVLGQLYDYIGRLSAHRRSHPGDDLLSMLIDAEAKDQRLSKDELAALVANLLFAGHDTTRSQLMIAFYLLAAHPDQFQCLKADPSLAVNAGEEIVRFEPSVVGTARQPFEDTVICDVPVAAGTPVQVALISASRDPLAYENPDRFDIERTDSHPINFGAVSTIASGPPWPGARCRNHFFC